MSKRKYNNRREPIIADFLFNFAMITGFLVLLVALLVFLHRDQFDLFNGDKEKPTNHYDIDLGTNDSTLPIDPDKPGDTVAGNDRPVVLEIPEDAYFATSTVNIREQANTTSEKLGRLLKYDFVVVESIENGWAKIKYEKADSGYAFISSDYLNNDKEYAKEAKEYLMEAAAEEAFASDSIVDKTAKTYSSEAFLEDLEEFRKLYPNLISYDSLSNANDDGNNNANDNNDNADDNNDNANDNNNNADDSKDTATAPYIITLGNKDAEKKILIYGCTSGETTFPQLLMACQIEYYLESQGYWYDKEKELTYESILDDVAICFIPEVNSEKKNELSEDDINALNAAAEGKAAYVKYFCDSKSFTWDKEKEPSFTEALENDENSYKIDKLYDVWKLYKELAILIASENVG